MSEFRFHTSSAFLSIVRVYGYHLWKMKVQKKRKTDEVIVPDVIMSREAGGETEIMCGLPVGRYEVIFRDTPIDIETNESILFKGTGSYELKKWIDVWTTIRAETREEAEKVLERFVNEALKFTQKIEEGKVSVQIYEVGFGWRNISNLPKRPMDTIYLDPAEKEKILSDIQSFRNEEADYVTHGIPYKRCYLFHGLPGSGKTSLIFAIASILDKDIGIFNFSGGASDTTFISAVSQLSPDRILVLEDLDSLFSLDRRPSGTNHVSFSALLNVLDGVCRKDRQLTFLTTNHMNRLDPALLRPGRVDYVLEFKFAAKNQIKEMFTKFLPRQEHNFEAFYELVRGKKINMSLVQKFLFERRKKPDILAFEKELDKLIDAYEEKERMDII